MEVKRYRPTAVVLYTTPAIAVLQTAHTSLQGFFWLVNPIASGKVIAIREIDVRFGIAAAVVALSVPRITFQRILFTAGTPSGGTQYLPNEPDTRAAAPVGDIRTVTAWMTGLQTVNANSSFFSALPPNLVTAVGILSPNVQSFRPEPDQQIVLLPGEGIVCQQPDNGTASDPRQFVAQIKTEEYTLA